MPLEGLQLGKYRLVRLIGSGGMGDVYLGEDVRLSRQLAIKVMRAEVSPYPDEDAVKDGVRLFQREMKAIATLDHPHILPLYDYGEELLHQTTLIYMVMPFRPEGSLADWLRQRNPSEPLPLQDIASLVSQAAEALQKAHDHQIIHQDVKLSNFLIRRKKDVSSPPDLQLADFGIAKINSATSSMSHASRGTPISMAPEQWNGDPVPATDQYALAIMTYQLLTGRPPFRGRPEQMMYQHLTVPPPPPSTFRKDLPASIDAVLLHALAKRPQERFPSISEFAVAFQQAMQSTGDLYATLAISEGEAATGTKRELMLPGGRKAQVSLPQGVQDKQVLRLEGLGEPYYAGGPLGALVLLLSISSQDKTALSKEAGDDETVASSGSPNARSKAVLTSSSSQRTGTTETRDEPSPPPSEVSAVSVDPQRAQKSKPSIPKVNIWKIGKRQVVAAIIGIVLFGVLDYVLGALVSNAPSNSPLFNPIGGLSFSPYDTFIGVLYGLIFTVPLFFAVEFGPWVGLASVVIGAWLGDYAAFHSLIFPWYLYTSDAIFAFISGLALLQTRGRYDNWRAITTAVIMSAIGIISSNILVAIGDSIAKQAVLFNDFLGLTLLFLLPLILLPILLVIYNRIANRGKSTSTTP